MTCHCHGCQLRDISFCYDYDFTWFHQSSTQVHHFAENLNPLSLPPRSPAIERCFLRAPFIGNSYATLTQTHSLVRHNAKKCFIIPLLDEIATERLKCDGKTVGAELKSRMYRCWWDYKSAVELARRNNFETAIIGMASYYCQCLVKIYCKIFLNTFMDEIKHYIVFFC